MDSWKVNVNKSTRDDNIPPKILQISTNVLDKPITTVIDLSISEMTFLNKSKKDAVVPFFKLDDIIDKKNYRPVSILTLCQILSKMALTTKSHLFWKTYCLYFYLP